MSQASTGMDGVPSNLLSGLAVGSIIGRGSAASKDSVPSTAYMAMAAGGLTLHHVAINTTFVRFGSVPPQRDLARGLSIMGS